MRKHNKVFGVLVVLGLTAPALLGSSKLWLHVHVEEGGQKPEKVKVNIPLALAESVAPLLQDTVAAGGKIRIPHKGLKVEDLRAVWQTLRAQGDAEYVTVESEGGQVRVFTRGNYLYILSDEKSKDKVSVQIPLQVVDAVFAGEGDELDLLAAVRALQGSGVGDLVSIQSEDSTVKVWIDDKNSDQ